MEEVDLRGVQTSWSCRHCEVNRSNHTNASLSWHLIGLDFSLELEYGSIAENKRDFFLEERSEIFKFRDFASELLFKVSELFLIDAFGSHFDDFFDEGLNV